MECSGAGGAQAESPAASFARRAAASQLAAAATEPPVEPPAGPVPRSVGRQFQRTDTVSSLLGSIRRGSFQAGRAAKDASLAQAEASVEVPDAGSQPAAVEAGSERAPSALNDTFGTVGSFSSIPSDWNPRPAAASSQLHQPHSKQQTTPALVPPTTPVNVTPTVGAVALPRQHLESSSGIQRRAPPAVPREPEEAVHVAAAGDQAMHTRRSPVGHVRPKRTSKRPSKDDASQQTKSGSSKPVSSTWGAFRARHSRKAGTGSMPAGSQAPRGALRKREPSSRQSDIRARLAARRARGKGAVSSAGRSSSVGRARPAVAASAAAGRSSSAPRQPAPQAGGASPQGHLRRKKQAPGPRAAGKQAPSSTCPRSALPQPRPSRAAAQASAQAKRGSRPMEHQGPATRKAQQAAQDEQAAAAAQALAEAEARQRQLDAASDAGSEAESDTGERQGAQGGPGAEVDEEAALFAEMEAASAAFSASATHASRRAAVAPPAPQDPMQAMPLARGRRGESQPDGWVRPTTSSAAARAAVASAMQLAGEGETLAPAHQAAAVTASMLAGLGLSPVKQQPRGRASPPPPPLTDPDSPDSSSEGGVPVLASTRGAAGMGPSRVTTALQALSVPHPEQPSFIPGPRGRSAPEEQEEGGSSPSSPGERAERARGALLDHVAPLPPAPTPGSDGAPTASMYAQLSSSLAAPSAAPRKAQSQPPSTSPGDRSSSAGFSWLDDLRAQAAADSAGAGEQGGGTSSLARLAGALRQGGGPVHGDSGNIDLNSLIDLTLSLTGEEEAPATHAPPSPPSAPAPTTAPTNAAYTPRSWDMQATRGLGPTTYSATTQADLTGYGVVAGGGDSGASQEGVQRAVQDRAALYDKYGLTGLGAMQGDAPSHTTPAPDGDSWNPTSHLKASPPPPSADSAAGGGPSTHPSLGFAGRAGPVHSEQSSLHRPSHRSKPGRKGAGVGEGIARSTPGLPTPALNQSQPGPASHHGGAPVAPLRRTAYYEGPRAPHAQRAQPAARPQEPAAAAEEALAGPALSHPSHDSLPRSRQAQQQHGAAPSTDVGVSVVGPPSGAQPAPPQAGLSPSRAKPQRKAAPQAEPVADLAGAAQSPCPTPPPPPPPQQTTASTDSEHGAPPPAAHNGSVSGSPAQATVPEISAKKPPPPKESRRRMRPGSKRAATRQARLQSVAATFDLPSDGGGESKTGETDLDAEYDALVADMTASVSVRQAQAEAASAQVAAARDAVRAAAEAAGATVVHASGQADAPPPPRRSLLPASAQATLRAASAGRGRGRLVPVSIPEAGQAETGVAATPVEAPQGGEGGRTRHLSEEGKSVSLFRTSRSAASRRGGDPGSDLSPDSPPERAAPRVGIRASIFVPKRVDRGAGSKAQQAAAWLAEQRAHSASQRADLLEDGPPGASVAALPSTPADSRALGWGVNGRSPPSGSRVAHSPQRPTRRSSSTAGAAGMAGRSGRFTQFPDSAGLAAAEITILGAGGRSAGPRDSATSSPSHPTSAAAWAALKAQRAGSPDSASSDSTATLSGGESDSSPARPGRAGSPLRPTKAPSPTPAASRRKQPTRLMSTASALLAEEV